MRLLNTFFGGPPAEAGEVATVPAQRPWRFRLRLITLVSGLGAVLGRTRDPKL
jgi:hypothetical protein